MKKERSAGIVLFLERPEGNHFLLLNYPTGHWDFIKGKIEKGDQYNFHHFHGAFLLNGRPVSQLYRETLQSMLSADPVQRRQWLGCYEAYRCTNAWWNRYGVIARVDCVSGVFRNLA